MKRRLPALAALALLLLLPALARASGGDSIASAPELPLRQQQFGDVDRFDYWRVTMNAGDLLTANFGLTGGDLDVGLCVIRPDVTDYTKDGARCVAYRETGTKSQLKFIATTSGRWTLVFGANWYGCLLGSGSQSIDITWDCTRRVAYEVTAAVQRYTETTLSAPRTVRVGAHFTLRGRVAGAGSGSVQLERRMARHWRIVKSIRLGSDGSYSLSTRARSRGLLRFRARYLGDASHRPSGATVRVRVG
jgi:hypothetical protein